MSPSRKELRQQLSRDVSVRQGKDRIDVSFRYMTPGRARLANALFRLLPIPFYICLLVDAGQATAMFYGQDAEIVRYAHGYLGVIYDIYSYAGQSAADLFYTVALDAPPQSRLSSGILLLFGSGFVVTLLVSAFCRTIESRDLAPGLLSPILGARGHVDMSSDEVRLSRKKFPLNDDSKFMSALSRRTRNKVRRSHIDEQSMTLYFVHGANPVPVATIFGIEKAENIAANLNYIIENSHNFLKSN
jgi:hypothetical protein